MSVTNGNITLGTIIAGTAFPRGHHLCDVHGPHAIAGGCCGRRGQEAAAVFGMEIC